MTPPLVLLHGALGCAAQFDELKKLLPNDLPVSCPEFYGHSNTAFVKEFTIDSLAKQVLEFMDEVQIEKANFFGHSMGGYVALHLAKTSPERVSKVFTLGTMLKWDDEILQKELRMMDAEKMEEKLPAFAAHLDKTHTHGWKILLEKTKDLLTDLVKKQYMREEALGKLETPVRLGIGDRDTSAGVVNTVHFYLLLKQGQLEVFPNTPHPYERVTVGRLAASIVDFCG